MTDGGGGGRKRGRMSSRWERMVGIVLMKGAVEGKRRLIEEVKGGAEQGRSEAAVARSE